MIKVAPVSADLLIKLAIGLSVIGALYVAYSKAKAVVDSAGNAIKEAGNAVIAAPEFVYDQTVQGVNSVGDWVNQTGETITSARDSAFYAVNPMNNENVIYQTANAATGGSTDQTIGTRLYDFLNPDPLNTGGATGTW